MKKIVIINEQHSLLPEQRELLKEIPGQEEIIRVPARGWTLEEMREINERLRLANDRHTIYIFVSPVPWLLKTIARWSPRVVKVFHNDRREKKTLPDGKIIYTIPKEGWQLL